MEGGVKKILGHNKLSENAAYLKRRKQLCVRALMDKICVNGGKIYDEPAFDAVTMLDTKDSEKAEVARTCAIFESKVIVSGG